MLAPVTFPSSSRSLILPETRIMTDKRIDSDNQIDESRLIVYLEG
jgi:hypothetical protein